MLRVPQACVGPAQVQQLLGRALLLKTPAAAQHQDVVRVPDGGEAVRDADGGAASSRGSQGLQDPRLRQGVQRGRGLVEHQDGRVLEHGTGDGNSLLLAPRQLEAALAHLQA